MGTGGLSTQCAEEVPHQPHLLQHSPETGHINMPLPRLPFPHVLPPVGGMGAGTVLPRLILISAQLKNLQRKQLLVLRDDCSISTFHKEEEPP